VGWAQIRASRCRSLSWAERPAPDSAPVKQMKGAGGGHCQGSLTLLRTMDASVCSISTPWIAELAARAATAMPKDRLPGYILQGAGGRGAGSMLLSAPVVWHARLAWLCLAPHAMPARRCSDHCPSPTPASTCRWQFGHPSRTSSDCNHWARPDAPIVHDAGGGDSSRGEAGAPVAHVERQAPKE
jgi:hypothetical protein